MKEWHLSESLVREDVLLADYSTIRVGGNARYFFEVGSEEDLVRILGRCRAEGIPLSVLGGGSDTLIPDEGTDGGVLWIGKRFSGVEEIGAGRLIVRAGTSVPELVRKTADMGLAGLEFACGIPATAGGATVTNCGAFGGEWAERVLWADALENGKFVRISAKDCGFSYRKSVFMQQKDLIVVSVCLELSPDEPTRIRSRIREITALRRKTQGVTQPSLGSVFRRTEGAPPPARLIDECGLKGYRIGGAAVSEAHAGFIVNLGGATCQNICSLILHISSTVRKKYGIILQEEIRRL